MIFDYLGFFAPALIYVAFAGPALWALRSRDLDERARALWALLIVVVPVMGAMAFAIVAPGVRC